MLTPLRIKTPNLLEQIDHAKYILHKHIEIITNIVKEFRTPKEQVHSVISKNQCPLIARNCPCTSTLKIGRFIPIAITAKVNIRRLRNP